MILSEASQSYLRYLRACGYSQATISLYRYVQDTLTRFLNDKEVERIRPDGLTNYFVFLQDEYKPIRFNGDDKPLSGSSLQKHWSCIRTFFKWASEVMGLKRRPDANLKLPSNNPKVIIPFSQSDVKALLVACEYIDVHPGNRKAYRAHRPTYLRDQLIIIVLLNTGIRAGELCRLNVGDINLDTGDVYIAPYGNSKRKTKSRVVHLGKSGRKAALRYLMTRVGIEDNDPLFAKDRGGGRITYNSIRLLISELGDKTGVQDCHAHRFRHTFCIEFLRNHGDVYNLMAMTGHSSMDMLREYVQIAQGDTARIHKIANPGDNWGL
jgi:site-specific recombinase XerD